MSGISQKFKVAPITLMVTLALIVCTFTLSNLTTGPTVPEPVGLAATGEQAEAIQLPPEASKGWWNQVQQRLAASEYEFNFSDGRVQAPNRAQDFRIRFDETGLNLQPRGEMVGGWNWSWQTTGWGRSGVDLPVAAAQPLSQTNRVEYDRGEMVEWYENGTEGLEQGFTIANSPAGVGELKIEGRINSDLIPVFDPASGEINFRTAAGSAVLRYDKLIAWDAEGRELPTRLAMADDLIQLLVDDSDAIYPVVVDPLLSTPHWEFQPDRSYVNAGKTVATAGDVNGDGYSDVIVGAPAYDYYDYQEGRVFLFLGGPDGLDVDWVWHEIGGQMGVNFGCSISSAGDVNGDGLDDVIVGGQWDSTPGGGQGNAWIFLGTTAGTGLEHLYFWDNDDNDTSSNFGASVSRAGDVNGDGYDDVIIGAPEEDHGGLFHSGRVYVYTGGPSGMTLFWGDSYPYETTYTGHCVSAAGDVDGDGYDDVIYSCHSFVNEPGQTGLVTVARGGASTMTPDWSVTGEAAGSYFGWSVATAGDVNGDGYADILIGAPSMEDDQQYNEGWVYLHYGGAGGLNQQYAWHAEGESIGAKLGVSVATAGDVNGDGLADVILGAPEYSSSQSEDKEGRAYVYLGNRGGLRTDYYWSRQSNQLEAEYGYSVGTAGDVNGDGFSDVIVGSWKYDEDETNEGRAFVYLGGGYMPLETAGWWTESNQVNSELGFSVAGAGDVNGDGYSDVLVGAPWFDNGQTDEGVVFLFLGNAMGLNYAPAWYAESDQANAHFGFSVANAGDVNGDGLEDILVGASWYGSGYEGAAFLWHSVIGGGPMGNPTNADWSHLGDQTGAQYGHSVCGAGDVNGDGYADIAVGAPYSDYGTTGEGAVFGYSGSETGLPEEHDWFHDTDSEGASFGQRVSTAGDFNGDGYSDLLVGAPHYNHGQIDEGLIFIYTGSEDGLQTGAPYWWAESDQVLGGLGSAVACAGDINGDGYSDILAGAPYYEFSGTDRGAVFAWFGGPTDPPNGNPGNADWSITYPEDYAHMGMTVSSAGDFDGDGFSDVIVGCPDLNGTAGYDVGGAFIFRGTSDGVYYLNEWSIYGDQEYGHFGYAVCCAGDVDGDGFSDVIATAPDYTFGHDEEGLAWLFQGNDGRGRPVIPQQWQGDFSRLAPLGITDVPNTFAVSATGRSAAGRSDVRMVCEVKPYGTPFDGDMTATGPWFETGVPGDQGSTAPQTLTINTLAPNTLYHWRGRILSDNPLFPGTSWFGIQGNGMCGADFRTGGTGSAVPDQVAAAPFQLRNYPNPFNPRTTLSYNLPVTGKVKLDIYDPQGRRQRTLVDGVQGAGEQQMVWDGRSDGGELLPSGVYFARLHAGTFTESRKLIMVK